MKENRLTYISCSTIPSSFANSVHVMKMCNSFAEQGLSVNLVCKQSESWIDAADALKSYGCKNEFTVSAFSSKRKGILYSLSYIFYAMRKVMRAKGFVYSRYFYPLVPLFFRKTPFALEFHNDINRIDKLISLSLIKKNRCKLIVFISEALKDLFVSKYNADPQKCIVLSDACDVADIERHSSKAVGYVGHLYKGRGIELLIDIANKLPELQFHLIGGKEPELSYYRSISPSNMILYGSVKHAELPAYYNKFCVALAPYQEKIFAADKRCETSNYCSPMKLFEYMSYKKAIICSDLPVFHEVGKDGEDLLFRPCDDTDGWVNAIKQLMDDNVFRETIVENAYQRFLNNYTWRSRVERIINRIES